LRPPLRRRGTSGWGAGAADLCTRVDVAGQHGPHFLGVGFRQVDLVLDPVNAEPDSLVRLGPVDVVNQHMNSSLRHRTAPVPEFAKSGMTIAPDIDQCKMRQSDNTTGRLAVGHDFVSVSAGTPPRAVVRCAIATPEQLVVNRVALIRGFARHAARHPG